MKNRDKIKQQLQKKEEIKKKKEIKFLILETKKVGGRKKDEVCELLERIFFN